MRDNHYMNCIAVSLFQLLYGEGLKNQLKNGPLPSTPNLYQVLQCPKSSPEKCVSIIDMKSTFLRGVEWVHGLFLFPLVLGKM